MAAHCVIRLLDSARGHPLQSWTFSHQLHVTIGRADDNDIVVADPYVSRAHAYLQFDEETGAWRLISISSQQIVCQGETRQELPLSSGLVFRLGQHGCYLRFESGAAEDESRKTISFDATLTPVFALDKDKMLREVSEIVDGEYFQSLKEAAELQRQKRSTPSPKPR